MEARSSGLRHAARASTAYLLGWLRQRAWAAFVVAGLSFLAFGLLSLNVVNVLAANLALLADHGWMAAGDGAVRQLFELLASGYAALACFLVFKLCERIVVDWLHSFR